MNFFRIIEGGNKSECVKCGKILSRKKISNWKRHYALIHKQDINEKEILSDEDSPQTSAKKIKCNNRMDKNEFLKCCVGLVTAKNLPFRIFDDRKYFKPLISQWEQKFQTNINSRNIVSLLESFNANIREEIKRRVSNKMISLKVDIATRMDKSILGINIQYIKDFKICINTIGKYVDIFHWVFDI